MRKYQGFLCALGVGLVIATTIQACGGKNGRVGEQPSWRKRGDKATARDFAAIVFAPKGPSVDSYNSTQTTHLEFDERSAEIVAAARRAAEQAMVPAPEPDPRLFAAARELASVAPENAPLAYQLVEFALQRHGIIEPSPHMMVIWGPADDSAEEIAKQVSERLPPILREGRFSRVGVGTAKRNDGEACTVLAFQASYVKTLPVPRSQAVGSTLTLSGSVVPPYTDPQVFVTQSGAVSRPKVTRPGKNEFRAQVRCPVRGVQQIEITAVDDSGSTVLANFPVWCGEQPPQKVVIEPSLDDTSPVTSESAADQRMLDLINQDRSRGGLRAIAADEKLSRVARDHSREMRETGRVAHVSPVTGSAADRVQSARIRTAVVLENVARAYGVSEAQEGLMNSPGHRSNILSPEISHVGIGIAFGEQVAGRREMFITQVFAKLPSPMSVSQATKALKNMIEGYRRIAEDAALSQVARTAASGIASGQTAEAEGKRASQKLDQMNLRYASITTVVTTLADIEAFDPKDILKEPTTTNYGIGVAQGNHPIMGDGAYFVVILGAQR